MLTLWEYFSIGSLQSGDVMREDIVKNDNRAFDIKVSIYNYILIYLLNNLIILISLIMVATDIWVIYTDFSSIQLSMKSYFFHCVFLMKSLSRLVATEISSDNCSCNFWKSLCEKLMSFAYVFSLRLLRPKLLSILQKYILLSIWPPKLLSIL